jgi:hypothetical protein
MPPAVSLKPLLLIALLAATPARAAGPTVAVEDTLYSEEKEVLVTAPRVTMDEILDRVARGERQRDSLLQDQTFTVAFRLVRDSATPGKQPVLERESVTRVWRKRPDKVRSVVLRDYEARAKKPRARASVTVGSDMGEGLMDDAFRPENRRDYRYRIVGRDLVGDQLIYRLAFEPRSRLDPSIPSGVVWINTNDFVIVRQELTFERSPASPIISKLDRLVIERQRADGHWVLKRLAVRGESLLPLPGLGRSFDMSVQFSEYAINRGLPDSLFAAPEGGRR